VAELQNEIEMDELQLAAQLRECVAMEHLELKVMHKYKNFLGYKCSKNERGTERSIESQVSEIIKVKAEPAPKPKHGLASKLLEILKFGPLK
jgi:hypothetical protein